MNDHNLINAEVVCRLLEPPASKLGFHVALTGGVLYKAGVRKDIDVLFYGHNAPGEERTTITPEQVGEIVEEAGGKITGRHSHVIRCVIFGLNVDVILLKIDRSGSKHPIYHT